MKSNFSTRNNLCSVISNLITSILNDSQTDFALNKRKGLKICLVPSIYYLKNLDNLFFWWDFNLDFLSSTHPFNQEKKIRQKKCFLFNEEQAKTKRGSYHINSICQTVFWLPNNCSFSSISNKFW